MLSHQFCMNKGIKQVRKDSKDQIYKATLKTNLQSKALEGF